MNRIDFNHDDVPANKELSTRSATYVAEAPSWTTRAKPTGISRVPTHAVRPVEERRAYTRANLSLPLSVKRIGGQRDKRNHSLRTANISSSGVSFIFPQQLDPGTEIEIEVCLVDRPLGRGTVKMRTEAHVVRSEPATRPGWHSLAVCFDDITFQREEPFPSRFQR
jgi:hypothetical protein